MEHWVLGRTGIRISALGMGTGGHKVLGQGADKRPEAEMRQLLHRAFDLGINYFDTSPGYADGGSERILGQALQDLPRDQVVISTKVALAGGHTDEVRIMRPDDVVESVEGSLRRLQIDTIDILLMAVAGPKYFDAVVTDLVPVLHRLRDRGKIRFIGSSEQSRSDGAHAWLKKILPTGLVDVAMVAHNLINQSAQRTVFPVCRERSIGVANVFAVRNLFGNPARLQEVIQDLKRRGVLSGEPVPDTEPLGWLTEDGDARSLVEAAYRYAAFTEAVTTVLCGTIDAAKLEENVAFMAKGPLAAPFINRLSRTFGHIEEPIGN